MEIPDLLTDDSGTPLYRGTDSLLTVFAIYSVVIAAILWIFDALPTAVRILVGLPLFLFVPGYAVLAALFPRGTAVEEDDMTVQGSNRYFSTVERAVLSVIVSVVVVPMIAFVASVTVGVYLGPVLFGILLVTVLASIIATSRESPAESGTGFSSRTVGDTLAKRDWKRSLSNRITIVAVVLTILLLSSSAAIAFTGNSDPEPRTEFYMTGDNGTLSAENIGNNDIYHLWIAQHGSERQRYTVVVTTRPSETEIEQNPGTTELDRFSVTADPGETAQKTYRLSSKPSANSTLRFLLYTGTAPADPGPESAHRILRVSVNETG